MRITGKEPARKCKSDAPKLIAIRNQSSILLGILKSVNLFYGFCGKILWLNCKIFKSSYKLILVFTGEVRQQNFNQFDTAAFAA